MKRLIILVCVMSAIICLCGSENKLTSTVEISQPVEIALVPEATPEPVAIVQEPKYTEEELFYMAATIYNEAGGNACSDDTRRMVGYVVLNRVNDPRFPNTIKEVLLQKSQYGRFHWTGIKFAKRASYASEQAAVERAYRIAKECLEADPIPIPPTVVFQAGFIQGTSVYKYQDGTYFCHIKEVK